MGQTSPARRRCGRLITEAKQATTADIMPVFFNNSQDALQYNWQGGAAADVNPVANNGDRLARLFAGERPGGENDDDAVDDDENAVGE